MFVCAKEWKVGMKPELNCQLSGDTVGGCGGKAKPVM